MVSPRASGAPAFTVLGLLTFAAVLNAGVECKKEPVYLGTETGAYITTEKVRPIQVGERRQCRLVAGRFQIPLPALAAALTIADRARELLKHI
jgi:hypothetical protein